MKITNKVIENAYANYLTIDELVFIYNKFFDLKWSAKITPASINKLIRLGLLDAEYNLTSDGETILFYCIEEESALVPKNDRFEEIWVLFPRDDGFREFSKTRMIRWNKSEAKKQYEELLSEVSHDELVKALNKELEYRSTHSTKENLFKYMRGPVNWFKERTYLEFVDYEPEEKLDYGKQVS